MNLTRMLQCLLLGFALHISTSYASTNLAPSLEFFGGDEKFSGKLAFLLEHNYMSESNLLSSASIYEFDLEKFTLHKITDSPRGQLFASKSGKTFCVIYGLVPYH